MKDKSQAIQELVGQGNTTLLAEELDNLNQLDLMNFTDSQIKTLANALLNNSTITKISLKNSKISDEGFKSIAGLLEKNHTITIIDMPVVGVKNHKLTNNIHDLLTKNIKKKKLVEEAIRKTEEEARKQAEEAELEALRQNLVTLQDEVENKENQFKLDKEHLEIQLEQAIVKACEEKANLEKDLEILKDQKQQLEKLSKETIEKLQTKLFEDIQNYEVENKILLEQCDNLKQKINDEKKIFQTEIENLNQQKLTLEARHTLLYKKNLILIENNNKLNQSLDNLTQELNAYKENNTKSLTQEEQIRVLKEDELNLPPEQNNELQTKLTTNNRVSNYELVEHSTNNHKLENLTTSNLSFLSRIGETGESENPDNSSPSLSGSTCEII